MTDMALRSRCRWSCGRCATGPWASGKAAAPQRYAPPRAETKLWTSFPPPLSEGNHFCIFGGDFGSRLVRKLTFVSLCSTEVDIGFSFSLPILTHPHVAAHWEAHTMFASSCAPLDIFPFRTFVPFLACSQHPGPNFRNWLLAKIKRSSNQLRAWPL